MAPITDSKQTQPMAAERRLALVLRIIGVIDLLALLAVVAPRSWLEAANDRAGLEPMPELPLLDYLARSASLMYVLYGAVLLFVSRDVQRYRPLIRLLAWLAAVHGPVVFAINISAGLPAWWIAIEGPVIFATGMLLLMLLRGMPPRTSLAAPNQANPH